MKLQTEEHPSVYVHLAWGLGVHLGFWTVGSCVKGRLAGGSVGDIPHLTVTLGEPFPGPRT